MKMMKVKKKITMEKPINLVDVLDKGYVRLVDNMGSDLSVVNAAELLLQKKKIR